MRNKQAYFQGTENPKKYPVDKAILVQPRFEMPFFKNYDIYNTPGKYTPGSGYHDLMNYKSVKDFLEDRRKLLKNKYKADDSYIEDSPKNYQDRIDKMKLRASLLNNIIKIAKSDFTKLEANLMPPKSIKEIDKKAGGGNFDYGQGLYSQMNDGKIDSIDKFHYLGDNKPINIHKLIKKYKDHQQAKDYMLPPKEHGTSIYDWHNSIYQGIPGKHKKDSNNIDYPLDEQINHYDQMIYPSEESYQSPEFLIGPDPLGDLATYPSDVGLTDQNSYINSTQIGGEHSYLPYVDFEDRSYDALNFGRDYTEEVEYPNNLDVEDLEKLMNKYLSPAETDLFGLPDGMDPADLDADKTVYDENPFTGISDIGSQMYEDKWNI